MGWDSVADGMVVRYLRHMNVLARESSGKLGSVIGGVPEGYDAAVLSELARKVETPVVFVARDDRRFSEMAAALAFFAPDVLVYRFPAWDCLPYDRISPNPGVTAQRMATLSRLAERKRHPAVLLATVSSVCQSVPARDVLADSSITASVGQRIDLDMLHAYFRRMGFSRTPTVTEPGDYSVRGGLIDVFPPGMRSPVRLDLFGDKLDAARRFDPETQRSTRRLARVEFAPVSEVFFDEDSIARFRVSYRSEFGAARHDDTLYEAVSEGRKIQGIEHWLPFFHARLDNLLDYVPNAPVCMDDGLEATHQKRWETISDQYDARVAAISDRTDIAGKYYPCPPDRLYLDAGRIRELLSGRDVRVFSPLPSRASDPDRRQGIAGRNFAAERQNPESDLFGEFAAHVIDRRSHGHVVIACYSEGSRERMADTLADQGIPNFVKIATWRDRREGPESICLTVWPLEFGFEAPGMTVISEQDILGDRLIRSPVHRKRARNFLTEARGLTDGDLVVHVDHGIGCFRGLVTIEIGGAPHECLKLEYARGDKLFLPAENIELLSRYGQETAPLDRLGAGAWQRRKARLRNRIRDMAVRLLRIAAMRQTQPAPVLEPPDGGWDRFCARFPYPETEDQIEAIEAVLGDLASGRPMDRLICGDVGFGKTEVALRAAYVAAAKGMQVAVVCPTTLLARQHFTTFQDRFRGTSIDICRLSRFVPAAEAADTRETIAAGRACVVIASHAVLSKTVKFSNLGLLIIDEEQNFGVAHKERLKELRADVHVLTMTATPIPRTLQMSLVGLRDLSLISTPPVDRLAVRTFYSSFDAVTAREALLRERYRGGQSFLIVPRISDIAEIADFLENHVPEVDYQIAHSRLSTRELDGRMNAFYDGDFDVLVATSIAANGLDIPTANTMIVYRPDLFGLAQLYQIRGRVGRSRVRAYAYLMTKGGARLHPAAEKRLRIISSLDSLGAGFSLASRDLDMRGAGNLLGEEQSGDVREVGLELYRDMLEDSVARLKTGEESEVEDDNRVPHINLGVPVLIPESYVADQDVRMGLYRRLAGVSERTAVERFASELVDRFGKLPPEVKMLLRIVRIKASCRNAGIGKFEAGKKGAVIHFHDDSFPDPAGLARYIEKQRGLAKVRGSQLIVRRDWADEELRVKGALIVARDIEIIARRSVSDAAATAS